MGQVYSALKPLLYADRIAAMSEGRVAPPVHVRIKPTNVCNHSCYFCAYRSGNVSLGEEMQVRDRIPRDKMMEIVDDLIAMNVRAATFSGGGEPTIYPYFAETVNRLGAAGIRIGVLTNGSRLLGKAADALARYATWVRISIDGWDGASYAEYRNVKPDEHAKVLANMAAFTARAPDCTVGVSIIVDEKNAAHIAELCARVAAAGARHAKISPCIVSNDGAANNQYHAPLMATVRRQIDEARAACGDGFEVVDHYHALPESFDKAYTSCPMARMLTVIGADCALYTCQDRAYRSDGRLGSIRERRLIDAWYADDVQDALRRLDPAAMCRHHCVADAKNRMLDDLLSLDSEHAAFV
jgi:MoaA/NifB/PqqE/SkfB family radical SAM enzyme